VKLTYKLLLLEVILESVNFKLVGSTYASGRVTRLGEFFAYRASVYFGKFPEKYRSCASFGLLFSTQNVMYNFLTKSGLGHVLGDVFIDSSGRPDTRPVILLTGNCFFSCLSKERTR
jgi:hypothetical protein